MSSIDFKEKRIEYINNWPNSEPFEIEKKYFLLIEKTKQKRGTIFKPFQLVRNDDVIYNKTVSFIIEALDQLDKYPNFSYEFLFKAYDCFLNKYYPSNLNITDKNKKLCDNEWKKIIDSNLSLKISIKKLLAVIPVKACQYLYIRITDHTGDNQPYKRVSTGVSGGLTNSSIKRREILDAIETKCGVDYDNYANSIRKASLLYRYILTNDTVVIDKSYEITIDDKLNILMSGFLYTLRNDIMHGSNIAITKSSKTTLGTYAIDYYAFLLLYNLLIILIINFFPNDYSIDTYNQLADNIIENLDIYVEMFGKHIKN
ncbi:hypothetical protein [Brotaphodocola sp.]|uniref:hypothetical protein n=1 Tax=Brotaphodocola sp. TaxID=3073577 RepID=UPI003D7DE817